MDEYNYDALASTVKNEDITSSGQNQEILRRLKDNDIQENLWISNVDDGDEDDVYYIPMMMQRIRGGWDISLVEIQVYRLSISSTEVTPSKIYLSAKD